MSTVTAAEIGGKPSHEDLRGMLVRTLNPGEMWGPDAPYIVEVGETSCIVSSGGKSYRYPYTVDEDGRSVSLGSPVEVKLVWEDADVRQAHDGERGTHAFLTDLRGLTFGEGGLATIEVCRDGTWSGHKSGKVTVTPELRESFVANFERNAHRTGDLPLDYDHETGPAPGWIKRLRNQGSSLFADVELTPSGRAKVEAGEYRFFSPEWHPDWKDRETGESFGPTLLAGALTNRPFFRGLQAIQFDESSAAGHTGAGGGATGAPPQREAGMSDTAQTGVKGAETPGETMTAAEAQRMQERLTALEVENAAFRAREERSALTLAFTEMRFGEGGRRSLAPVTREALIEALMPVPAEQRQKIVEAIRSWQFAELGARGFSVPEDAGGDSLSADEEKEIRAMAERNGLKFDELKASFAEVKKRRAQLA